MLAFLMKSKCITGNDKGDTSHVQDILKGLHQVSSPEANKSIKRLIYTFLLSPGLQTQTDMYLGAIQAHHASFMSFSIILALLKQTHIYFA